MALVIELSSLTQALKLRKNPTSPLGELQDSENHLISTYHLMAIKVEITLLALSLQIEDPPEEDLH